jgi:hypothetical protein
MKFLGLASVLAGVIALAQPALAFKLTLRGRKKFDEGQKIHTGLISNLLCQSGEEYSWDIKNFRCESRERYSWVALTITRPTTIDHSIRELLGFDERRHRDNQGRRTLTWVIRHDVTVKELRTALREHLELLGNSFDFATVDDRVRTDLNNYTYLWGLGSIKSDYDGVVPYGANFLQLFFKNDNPVLSADE